MRVSGSMREIKIGIIGGSGLEDADILQNVKEKEVTTPFGNPSDVLKIGSIQGVPCVLLSRHGRKHALGPSSVNYRANIWALHKEGCTHLLVSTACGSLKEQVVPGDIVILDQFIDRTTKRASTFYDGTLGGPIGVCHIPMAHPFCERTRQILIEVAQELDIKHHPTGTAVCIEGPRFSTKAESNLFRSWGACVVNMTTVPEASLAKEVGICYAAIALPTDYDCWKETTESVSVDLVLKTFYENSQKATDILTHAVKRISDQDWTDYLAEQNKITSTSIIQPPESNQLLLQNLTEKTSSMKL